MYQRPVQLVEDISPFMFPCDECKTFTFHILGMQPYGLELKVPILGIPLAASHKAFWAVCSECDSMNARVEKEDVAKLRNRIFPKSFQKLQPMLVAWYGLLAELDVAPEEFSGDPESWEEMKAALKVYRLESLD